jgi:O-antigen/teichoic acid export membrane protein
MTGDAVPGRQNMGHRVTRGLAWVGASQVTLQLTRFVVAIVIARLLTPGEYGLAAAALVFASLVLVFSDLAFGAALVQRKTISEDDRCTAFWLTVVSGVVFTVLGLLLASSVAALYGEPEVGPLMSALSFSFVLTAIGATQQSLLLREMNFRRLELMTMFGSLAGGAAAVVVAMLDQGAWAIIAQALVTAALSSALYWRASSWRPRFAFSQASLKDLWSFSGYLMGHRLLYYLHQNADRFLIGRYIGSAALGAYAVAYNVMLAPAARIGGPLQRVLAPAFSRMQDEPERIAEAWARVTRLIGAIAIPSLVTVVIVAPDFVPVVLGSQWEAAVPVIQIVAWVGILQALQSINVDILMARDRTRVLFGYAVFFCSAHVAAFIIGLHWGITGVAAAYAISSTFVEPVLTVITARALGVSPLVPVRSIAGVVQAAAIMAAAVLATRVLLVSAGAPAGARLAACSVVAAIVFGAACLWREPELKRELRTVIGRFKQRPIVVPGPEPAAS